ncbi:MAG: flavodoxin-dependent (E)-4-hydroxy-3-methylbut-2-enyl-diphosphate synthase [Clostridia bacterium]|nr:flavodoxin-dependent (E)-4-hydroxy-3-methylbut-2-enyl-diphosphate synthase [Clostridia bacterium]
MKRQVKVGKIYIGGGAPVSVQSMTNTPTLDYAKTLEQIQRLESAGCDIVRLAISSDEEVQSCRQIIGKTKAPLVADIQFNYRHAIACADIGFDKIRFNPGYLDSEDKVKEVVTACKRNGVPIRVGVNSGSLDKEVTAKYDGAEALAQSALKHIAILEKFGFYDNVISVKSSDVRTMVKAYEILDEKCDYPLHLGVTESGSKLRGAVKSSVGIGALLLKGIGDTIRVSLTGDPVSEVETAKMILGSLDLYREGVEIVSCPTCSRCEYDMENIVDTLENSLKGVKKRVKVAVMGCVVNGPGEAKGADIALCGGGKGKTALYVKGQVVKTIDQSDAVKEILLLIDKL